MRIMPRPIADRRDLARASADADGAPQAMQWGNALTLWLLISVVLWGAISALVYAVF
jgi:hypothetical protein